MVSLRARYGVAAAAARAAFSSREPQISLLTDFGGGDEAVYAVRSAARAVNPRARIEDICHNVPLGNILLGAWRLRRAVALPTESRLTAYVAVVDPGVGSERKDIIVRTNDGRFLIGPDNGVLSLSFDIAGIASAVEITEPGLTFLRQASSRTFHGKDVFAPAAAHLLRGVPMEEFGPALDPAALARITISARSTDLGRSGHLVDMDGFGSIRTNVPNHVPEHAIGREARFFLSIPGKSFEGSAKVVRTFSEARAGERIFVLSSTGCLDLAVSMGSAAREFGIAPESITVDASLRPTSRIELELPGG